MVPDRFKKAVAEGRVGCIPVSDDMIEAQPLSVDGVLYDMYISELTVLPTLRIHCFYGYSDQFDLCEPGQFPPRYDVLMSFGFHDILSQATTECAQITVRSYTPRYDRIGNESQEETT